MTEKLSKKPDSRAKPSDKDMQSSGSIKTESKNVLDACSIDVSKKKTLCETSSHKAFPENGTACESAHCSEKSANHKKNSCHSRITIKCDCGFPNNIYIRGNGANLNWNKGVLMCNTKKDEWVWETDKAFDSIQFKALINDSQYENGENHVLKHGQSIVINPMFC